MLTLSRVMVGSLTALTAALGVVVAGPVASAFASDGDCADLVSKSTRKSSNYAVVRNHCGHRIKARAVINNWPDTDCAYIAAGASREFRTGGSFSPTASAGREC